MAEKYQDVFETVISSFKPLIRGIKDSSNANKKGGDKIKKDK